jgi:exonuclease VII large subunit
MASERQIAANQSNARKSSGPRSGAGKKRASHNAYRHGLNCCFTSTPAMAKQVEKLARKIAGNTKDFYALEAARTVAQAELDLARVRRAKIALMESVFAFGELDLSQVQSVAVEAIQLFKSGVAALPGAIDSSVTRPMQQPDRRAEAMRRALPDLIRLDRYERRFCVVRDRAVLSMIANRKKATTGN